MGFEIPRALVNNVVIGILSNGIELSACACDTRFHYLRRDIGSCPTPQLLNVVLSSKGMTSFLEFFVARDLIYKWLHGLQSHEATKRSRTSSGRS